MTNVIFPQFEECTKYTLDPFWIDQFQNFAQNKFPSELRFDQNRNSLIFKHEKKNEVIALPDHPNELFSVMMDIMRNSLNLRSTRDLKIEKAEMDKIIEQRVCDTDCDWKNLKPRNLKDQLIMDYIGGLKEHYNLSPQETKNLIATVQIGFKFKYLSQDSVKYSKGKIRSIKGLQFNPKKRSFVVPYNPGRVNTTRPAKNDTSKFYTEIDKYLKTHNVRMNKYKQV